MVSRNIRINLTPKVIYKVSISRVDFILNWAMWYFFNWAVIVVYNCVTPNYNITIVVVYILKNQVL